MKFFREEDNVKRIYCTLLFVLFSNVVVGCASDPSSRRVFAWEGGEPSSSSIPPNYETVEKRKCLALSGGGIRAGAVSYGFLQGLGAKELGSFDTVTTVSGSGYATFGIIYDLMRTDSHLSEILSVGGSFEQEFGSRGFLDEEALIAGGLFTPPNMLLSWLNKSPNRVHNKGLFRSYASIIKVTFAPSYYPTHLPTGPSMTSIDSLKQKGFPEPLFVTSASPGSNVPSEIQDYDSSSIFVIGPRHLGSPEYNYWNTKDYPFTVRKTNWVRWLNSASTLQVLDAVVASASAIDMPSKNLPNGKALVPRYLKDLGVSTGMAIFLPYRGWVYLSDGGFVNNLGVEAALQHNCKHITIVDMGDDQHLRFKDFIDPDEKSKNTLEKAYKRLFEPEHRSNAVFSCDGLKPDDTKAAEAYPANWRLTNHVFKCSGKYRGQTTHNFQLVKLGMIAARIDEYPPSVKSFGLSNLDEYQDNKLCDVPDLMDRRCHFPHQATAVQNYKWDEFSAYRDLGTFMGCEYLRINKIHTNRTNCLAVHSRLGPG